MEDNNLTVTLKDGWRVPCYLPTVLQQDFGFMDDGEVTISTAEEEEDECEGSSETFKDVRYTKETENVCLLVV